MSEYTVYNFGICGEQTNQGILRFELVLSSIPDVKYVFILEGINDFMHARPFAEAVSNVISMVQIAKSMNIIPIVGTLTPWPGAEGYILPYNKMIISAGKEYNFQVIDMYSNLVDNWVSQYIDIPDSLHPNAKGYEEIANIWIKNVFPKNFCIFNNKYWYRDECHDTPPPMPGVYLLLLK